MSKNIQAHKNSVAAFLSDLPGGQARDLQLLDTEMQQNGKSRSEPIREIMGLIGDKWSHLILLILAAGPLGHAKLKTAIKLFSYEAAISQRILTLKLRALERNGLVLRATSQDIPPAVTYRISPLGTELVEHTTKMVQWIAASRGDIISARNAFDEAS